MLLGARQFFERRGAPTPPLPYDAEVESLESTGTQYMLTGISPVVGDILTIETDVQYSSGISSDTWLTGFWNNSSSSCLIGTYQNQIYFTYNRDSNNAKTSQGLYDRHRIRFNVPGGIYIDDTLLSSTVANDTALTATFSSGGGMPVFCRRFGGDYGGFIKAKCWSFKIWVNHVLVRDYVPVRAGTVGYMYDRVSGTLFGNAGTGVFVIGPDKS